MNIQKTIEENKRRLELLNSPYNPISGLGSPIPREKVSFTDVDEIYIPKEMLENSIFTQRICNAGSFGKFSEENEIDVNFAIEFFMRERFRYDFEYWAILTITIQDKETLQNIHFKSRKAQLILLEALESMRIAGVPIRIVLLKARQWGGSTLVQIYMMWIQQIHKTNWHLAVCAQDDGAASNISEMYKRAADHYPPNVGIIKFKAYARSPKNSVNVERGGIVGIGSINNPDQFRSYNYPMVHLSEVGLWQNTPKRSSAQLVQSLRSTVPRVPYSFIAIESTAKGVGTFFHDEWVAAEKKESSYKPVFIPFHGIEMYKNKIADYPSFIKSMNENDKITWDSGGTLESIAWYNDFMAGEQYELIQMQEEFPRTAEEAFVSTGQRVFPYAYISNARKNVQKPIAIGEIDPNGLTGKEALKNIEFHPNEKGNLKIWRFPEPFVVIDGKKFVVKNRYCGFADIGGINPKADFSCLKVIDRFWMLYGEAPETCALWHGHSDQDIFSWKCAQIATWYNKMLLAIESNSLKKEKLDGDYFITVLDQISEYYDNLYIRNNHESVLKDWVPKYGFHTGGGNKEMIITNLLGAFREETFIEKDSGSLDECDFYERKKDGSMGAVEGKKDDKVIITAGANWLANSPQNPMPPPVLVPYVEPGQRKHPNKKVIGESSF
jgi:hypothetical protein